MKMATETITPAQAKKYLQHNTENRAVRHAWVKRLAGMITRGEWKLTHQGIAFAKDGRLIDGQHRLLAIIEANKSAEMLVAREIDEAAYRHIDGGAPRKVADKLKFCEDPAVNRAVAAIVSMRAKITVVSREAPTIDQIEDEFLSYDAAYLAVGKAWTKRIAKITRAEVGAALVSYAAAHPDHADEFTNQLISGEQLYRGHPAYMLREGLIQGRIGEGRPLTETYYKCIAAMKAHLGKKIMNGVLPATEDFQGNTYTSLSYERARQAVKGAETKKGTAKLKS